MTPILRLDKNRAKNNLKRILAKCHRDNVQLIPHAKTHQSAEVADLYRENGIEGICVSSVEMAEYFASHGWEKVHLAFPYSKLEKENYRTLCSQINFSVNISSEFQFRTLEKENPDLPFYVELDAGYGRAGFPINQSMSEAFIRSILLCENFRGFYCHNGSTYSSKDLRELKELHEETIATILHFRNSLDHNIPIVYGDTPGISTADSLDGIDFVSAGNFLLYDLQQVKLESCTKADIAIWLECPVIQVSERKAIIRGGAIHLSKDTVGTNSGEKIFGEAYRLQNGEPGEFLGNLINLSQEHGTIALHVSGYLTEGECIAIYPAHSCLTADCMGKFVDRDNKVIYTMKGFT